jgi:hypothetical protein
MSKKSLETLTDKELMELASSKFNIFETKDQKPFRSVIDRKEITWLECPGEITIGELKKRLSTIPDDVTLEFDKVEEGCYETITCVYFYLHTIVPGIKTLTPEQREHIISDINLKISVQKQQEQECKEKLKLEELKELERLQRKYNKKEDK